MVRRWNTRKLAIGTLAGLVFTMGASTWLVLAAPGGAIWTMDPTDPRVTLEDVEREVIRLFPVPDIAPSTLASLVARKEVTLFDVRTREEFEAGHLPGAIRVEPGSTAEQILSKHRDKLNRAPVVFYCAVGVRSSRMLARTLQQIAPHATQGAYNLRGGIFRWTADGKTLVKGNEPGRAHPYNRKWGQLMARTVVGR